MKTTLARLCVPRVATTPGALGIAVLRNGGNHLLGTSPVPPFLRQMELAGVIRIHPLAEQGKGIQTLVLAHPDDQFRQSGYGERHVLLQACYTGSRLTYSSNLMAAYESGNLPRVVALTLNPDELGAYAKEIVGLWERLIADDILTDQTTIEQISQDFPGFAPACNGIVVDQFEQAINQETEASVEITRFLTGLKAKGPVIKKALLETIFRIAPLQAASRADSAEGPVFMPRKIGSLELGGGTPWLRKTARYLLDRNFDIYRRFEGDIYHNNYVSRLLREARAADYLKAMFTVNINALAIVLSLRDSGSFVPVTMGEMANTAAYAARVKAYAEAMFDIAYTAGYMTEDGLNFDDEFQAMIKTLRYNAAHPTSSVVAVQQLMTAGKLSAKLGPSELALLDPAIAEATRHGLSYYAELLTGLKTELISTLERLAQAQHARHGAGV